MKLLRWMLPLVLLLLFAMPVMASDSGPPGGVVAILALDSPLTPDPVLEAQNSVLTPLLAGFSGSPLDNSADQSQHPGTVVAKYEPIAVSGPYALFSMRPTSDTVQSAALRLWRPEGGVAFCRCTKPGFHIRA